MGVPKPALWTDNDIPVASDLAMMRMMVEQITDAFCQYVNFSGMPYFKWEPSSLEYTCVRHATEETLSAQQAGRTLKYECKS